MAARLRETLATPRVRLILVSTVLVAGGWIAGGVAHAQRPAPAVARSPRPVASSSRFADAAPALSPAGMRSVVIEHEPEYSPYAEQGQRITDDGGSYGGMDGHNEFMPGENFGMCQGPGCPDGQHCGQHCGQPCQNGCGHGCHHCPPLGNALCEPVGIWQRLHALDAHHGICHTFRADALILWRNAPPSRQLFDTTSGLPILNADQFNSPAAGGGRLSYFRQNRCGEAWEATYLYGGRFTDNRNLGFTTNPALGYIMAPPGIYGTSFQPLNEVDTVLKASIQSAELNRRWALGPSAQFLTGFRWLQWFETVSITDTYGAGTAGVGQDIYENSALNNLWGGQIGIDTLLLRTRSGFRTEGIVKAGVYANNAGQNAVYRNLLGIGGPEQFANSIRVREWPASASFVGEVGLTGVIPLDPNWDFRFGYLGLWLTGLAQPTSQLAGQNLAPPGDATTGTLNATGRAIVQGVTLGLEGRW
jgi:hypothetical protein